jgi:hypothetical protein
MARSELRGRSIRQARKLLGWPSFIPTSADQNPLAQSRRPMDMTAPGDLPIEGPTRFEFAVDARTAQKIGVVLLPSILLRADEVIE